MRGYLAVTRYQVRLGGGGYLAVMRYQVRLGGGATWLSRSNR